MTPIPLIDTELSADVLGQPIHGRHLGGAEKLGELVDRTAAGQPTLLVFVRHFG